MKPSTHCLVGYTLSNFVDNRRELRCPTVKPDPNRLVKKTTRVDLSKYVDVRELRNGPWTNKPRNRPCRPQTRHIRVEGHPIGPKEYTTVFLRDVVLSRLGYRVHRKCGDEHCVTDYKRTGFVQVYRFGSQSNPPPCVPTPVYVPPH